jgi:hypothetical protein
VAFLILSGSALAGTSTAVGGAVNYAREVGAVNAVFTLPAGKTVTRDLNVIRDSSQDFFVDVTLGNGALYTGAGATLPEASDLALTTAAGGAVTITLISGGTAGSATATYFVDITTPFTGLATFTLTVGGWTFRDPGNVLGAGTSAVQITVATRDSATGTAVDVGADTVTLAQSQNAVTSDGVVATTATVDVAQNRTAFLATGGDTTVQDNGATIDNNNTTANVNGLDGLTFVATATDTINIVIAGNLSGITTVIFDPAGVPVSKGVTADDVTAGTVVIPVPGNHGALNAPANIQIVVDGVTQLTARTLTVSSAYKSGLAGTAFAASQDHPVTASTTLTIWSLNGTVLVANWSNGNNEVLNSRFYLWNPSATGGLITVRIFALPVASSSDSGPRPFAGTPLATVAAGSVAGLSGRNLRLAEDLLGPAGIALPYTENGGNLIIEITIEASNVSGYTQTFSNTLAYGTTPLTKIN